MPFSNKKKSQGTLLFENKWNQGGLETLGSSISVSQIT
jgi:hypothetical protein